MLRIEDDDDRVVYFVLRSKNKVTYDEDRAVKIKQWGSVTEFNNVRRVESMWAFGDCKKPNNADPLIPVLGGKLTYR